MTTTTIRSTRLEAGEDLAARLAAEFDLELLELAKERVRSRVEAAHLAGVRGDRRRRAEAGRGRPRARHEGRRGLPGKAQRDRQLRQEIENLARSRLR